MPPVNFDQGRGLCSELKNVRFKRGKKNRVWSQRKKYYFWRIKNVLKFLYIPDEKKKRLGKAAIMRKSESFMDICSHNYSAEIKADEISIQNRYVHIAEKVDLR